ncbi:peptide ABC transporter permease [Paractinoplanes deccanensis]|uniref:Peptide ABC transporter permease n=1 Tax=Paractinoplanes deccanensis TaxID=113561 RepID=A0ABQ3Y2X3_9ACTN|nr:ABC transporter permease [Actinoplanes deccanensis]GID74344.1 peptide ABC transporter permease [Actinoplanes deccanensis]
MVVDIPLAPARHPLRRLLADRWAVAGGATILVLLLVAVAAPLLSSVEGHDPYTYDLSALDDSGKPLGRGGGISGDHWFGVEPMTGRDLFAIVVHGARTSLLVGVGATLIAVAIGVLVGVTAGYFGGWFDRVLSRITDVLLGFPWLVFVIALGAIAPARFPKQLLLVLVIGLFGWPGIARVVRGQTMALKQRTFVVASAALGAGTGHQLRRHYLPNLMSTIIVYATMTIPGMIGSEAALSFLGVGVPPPTPAWGRTIGEAIAWVQTDPMFLVFPGAALFLVTLAFNLFGDGLRDALDPRTAKR